MNNVTICRIENIMISIRLICTQVMVLIYYVAFQSRTHAFIMEGTFRKAGIVCELTYLPSSLTVGSCNIGIRLSQANHAVAAALVRSSGLPGVRLFQENRYHDQLSYAEIQI